MSPCVASPPGTAARTSCCSASARSRRLWRRPRAPRRRAVLRTHVQSLASRPRSIFGDILGYGPSDVGFAPYGDGWRQAKKLVTTHHLNTKKVQSYRTACEEDMFGAGTDTAYLVLEFTMAELMLHQDVMARLQAEVRSSIMTKDQQDITEEYLITAGMPYLKAVIKETLRLHPPSLLLLPHQSLEECTIDGYVVPVGTTVFVNAWAIGHDPRLWGDAAEKFMSERFINKGDTEAGVNFRGTGFQFLPFGSGRRMCPGLNFALANVEIMLANLVCHFDWEMTGGANEIDMTEVFGLTVHQKEKLILTPRLRSCVAQPLEG